MAADESFLQFCDTLMDAIETSDVPGRLLEQNLVDLCGSKDFVCIALMMLHRVKEGFAEEFKAAMEDDLKEKEKDEENELKGKETQ